MAKNIHPSLFVGTLTFRSYNDDAVIDTQSCSGKRDAEEHAAHLAVEHGGQIAVHAGETLLTVIDEEWFDA